MREALALCSRGLGGQRFLFEVLPDVFPQGFLTDTELILWGRFYDELKNRPE
ncbi:hypothetical protein [uncultured Desulfosarcina sp.]|uniref:hypothetical protein n=1 Tax=uncultured Desulfosarcina sp. TaxID=218289 RepID=UPI0029C67A3B|nr:hypothetical protein [uncultured Desulfosarcina sp.]